MTTVVSVWYEGRLEDGSLFDTNIKSVAEHEGVFVPERPYEPLRVMLGAHQVIQGFEDALTTMKQGETKTVTLPPEQAYGLSNPHLIRQFEKTFLQDTSVSVGDVLQVSVNKQLRLAKVTETNEKTVTLDLNHPLAGKTLVFTITVDSVEM